MIFAHLALWAAVGAASPAPATDLVAPGKSTVRIEAWRPKYFALQWQVPTVRKGTYRRVIASQGGPAIAVGPSASIIIGTGEGRVIALSAPDGDVLWRYEYGVPFAGSATIVPGDAQGQADPSVVLGAEDGALLALRVADGSLRWRADVGGLARAPVTVAGDKLVVATANNKLVVVDLVKGTLVWTKARPKPTTLVVDAHPRPAVDGDRIYAGYADGTIEAHSLADGSVLWSRSLATSLGAFVDATADPVVSAGRVYVASYSSGIFALNAKDGTIAWQKNAPLVTALSATEQTLLAGNADGYVWGFALADGQRQFRTQMSSGPISRMVVRGGEVALSAGEAGLVLLDAASGKPLQAMPMGGRAGGEPAWAGDFISILAENGELFSLRRLPPSAARIN